MLTLLLWEAGRKKERKPEDEENEKPPLGHIILLLENESYSGNAKYSHASVQLHPLLPSLPFSSSSAVFCFRVQKGRSECLLCLLANPESIRDFISGGLGQLIHSFFRKTFLPPGVCADSIQAGHLSG